MDRWRAHRLLHNRGAYDRIESGQRTVCEPFELRSGLHLHYGVSDDPIFLFLELFARDSYGLRRWYRPKAGDTICDIGGNIGWFALACCHYAGHRQVRIHSFEPDPDSYRVFKQNIEANALEDQLTVEQVAVANSIRTARLSRTHPLRRALIANDDGVPVSCLTLQEALARADGPIDLLKIDVEGGEVDILTEPAMLANVRRVSLEWHSSEALRLCRDTLSRAGFSAVRVERTTADLGMLWASRQ